MYLTATKLYLLNIKYLVEAFASLFVKGAYQSCVIKAYDTL